MLFRNKRKIYPSYAGLSRLAGSKQLRGSYTRANSFASGIIISIFTFLLVVNFNKAQQILASSFSISSPQIGENIQPASSSGDVRKLPKTPPQKRENLPEMPRLPRRLSALPAGPDLALQSKNVAAGKMPAVAKGFAGLDFKNWGAGHPPDTVGDVGPTYYIEAVNTSIGIFNKSDGSQVAAFTFDTLWKQSGSSTPCNGNSFGDPVVLYDPISDRWIISDIGVFYTQSGFIPPFYECIAVSKTSDPVKGGWYFYPIKADPNLLNDYPKFGAWTDAFYFSANMYDMTTQKFVNTRLWVLDRDKLVNGAPIKPVVFNLPCDTTDYDPCYFSLLPGNLRGQSPRAGTPEYFASIDWYTSNLVHVWKAHYDAANPSSSNLSGPTEVSVKKYTIPDPDISVPEQGGNPLDTLDNRLMMQLQYRNIGGTESLWLNHSVKLANPSTHLGIRWYQLDVTSGNVVKTPVQQGTFDNGDANYRWMGSLAADAQGNMALGYSVSSANLYPAIRYAGRLAGDPLGQLAQGEANMKRGKGSQTGSCGSYKKCPRWGDYSAMTVDPGDDCTFWYTQEYYATTGEDWNTWIGSFKFPACTGGGGPTSTPVPTPSSGPSPTSNRNCLCNASEACDASCQFDKYADVTYNSPIKCSREASIVGPTPSANDKNAYCQRVERTKGDTDGTGSVDNIDYFYYVSVVNGGGIPSSVDVDVNGDGVVSTADRDIIVRTLNSQTSPTPVPSGTIAPTPTSTNATATPTPKPTKTPTPTPTKKPTPTKTPTPTPCSQTTPWNDVNGNPPCTVPGSPACADWGGPCYQGWTQTKWQQCQNYCSNPTPTDSCTPRYRKYCTGNPVKCVTDDNLCSPLPKPSQQGCYASCTDECQTSADCPPAP